MIDADPARPIPPGDAVRVLRATDRAAEVREVADRVAALLARAARRRRASRWCTARCARSRTTRTRSTARDIAGRARRRSGALRTRPTCATRSRCSGRRSIRSTTYGRCARCRRRCCAYRTRRIAILCGEPANPQPALFALPENDTDTDRRWDRKRDLRLGSNVLRGERDADLSEIARERLLAFRARRARWCEWLRESDVATAARAIVDDGGLLLPRAGETSARARLRATLIERLIDADRRVCRAPSVRRPRRRARVLRAACRRRSRRPRAGRRTRRRRRRRIGRTHPCAPLRSRVRRRRERRIVPAVLRPRRVLVQHHVRHDPEGQRRRHGRRAHREVHAGTIITPSRAPRTCASSAGCSPPRSAAPTSP